MSIKHSDIDFIVENSKFTLHNIEQFEAGCLCGYITALLFDVENDTDYEVLFRITDKMNADMDNKLQSIDYGYKLKNSEVVFFQTEKELQKLVSTLVINYQEIDQYQKKY